MAGLVTLLRYLQAERHNRSEKYDETLEALRNAVRKTNEHYAIGKDCAGDEMELSNLWGIAAIKARNLSKDLAKACYIKRGYWKEPDRWTFNEIKEHGIQLEAFEVELERLLEK
jgi:hypothetical protein